MELQQAFDAAVARSRELPEKPSNETRLELYLLYKQATEGDVQGERPEGFDFKAMAKYEAWAQLKGKERKRPSRNMCNW